MEANVLLTRTAYMNIHLATSLEPNMTKLIYSGATGAAPNVRITVHYVGYVEDRKVYNFPLPSGASRSNKLSAIAHFELGFNSP